jgi:riboflavin biosynthesis pyrimidine reductase
MPRPSALAVAPLVTLYAATRGAALPLPPQLRRLYGELRMPLPRARPLVVSNFVSTLDGVVSLNVRGHASGGTISGFSLQDRMVMGLLRAVADVVVIGSGTLAADRRHLWTADAIMPSLAAPYRRLREALGKRASPLNVVVTGSGDVDLRWPVFASGKVRTLILTTTRGARRLAAQRIPATVAIRSLQRGTGAIPARAVLAAVGEASGGRMVLVEGGPRLVGDFYAEGLIDEQFLTLAPQFAGRAVDDRRLSLVMGHAFAPGDTKWGTLADARRGGSHLFLRYRFPVDGAKSQRRRR